MSEISYAFDVSPARREAAFFYVIFVGYPRLFARFLFRQRHTIETISYMLFCILCSPLLLLRNLSHLFVSTFPFLPDVRYRLTLHDDHMAFGFDDEDLLMAGAYTNIVGTFRVGKSWIALSRDGYIIYLQPGEEGRSVVDAITSRRSPPATSQVTMES